MYKSYISFGLLLIQIVSTTYANQWNSEDFLKREHSLSKPYSGANWDFVGTTIVTNKFIRLTSDVQSSKGGLWNVVPVQMLDWEVQFQFSVHGQGKDLFGDGFSFWYARDRNKLGDVFGSPDYFYGLAIILDTYSNHNGPHNHPHPYISAMVNNGSLHYDHDKDGTHTEIAGCEAPFRNKDHDTFVAVRYQNYKLTVSTDIENKNVWKECFSVENVKLPTGYFFGFSAATGDLSDNHDIISVKTYKLDSQRQNENIDTNSIMPSAAHFAEPREHHDDDKPSVLWHVIKVIFYSLLVIVFIIAAIYVGYMFYTKQSRSKKRFY